MDSDILTQQLKNGLYKKLYFFFGDCLYLKRFYLAKLRDTVISGEDSLTDVILCEDKNMTVREFGDLCFSVSLQSGSKFIIIKDFPLSSDVISYLADNAESIPDGTTVCIICEQIKYDARTKAYKAFLDIVKSIGLTVEINNLDRPTLEKWVAQNLKKAGKSISLQTVQYILDNIDNEMYSLKNEIDKLAAYAKNPVITEKDVDAVCTFTLESNSFLIGTSIIEKKADKALRVINDLMKQSDFDVNMVLGGIYKTLLNLCKINILSNKGYSQGEIAKLTGIKDFVVRNSMNTARFLNAEKTKKIADICTKADKQAKSYSVPPEEILTKLVAECICVL